MYGLEKQPKEIFEFDLQKEIKTNPKRKKEIQTLAEERVQEIKKELRAGANEKEFSRLNVLLQGYTALQKVLKRVK